MEFGLRLLRAVGSRYEPEAIGEGATPRRELGMRKIKAKVGREKKGMTVEFIP